MSLIKDSYKRYPMSWFYAAMGTATLIIGIMTSNGLISANNELSLEEVFGMTMMIFAGFVIMAAYVIYRIDRLENKEP